MSKSIRINKYLALCGLGSRRKTEDLISGKKIKLNGATVVSLNTMIDPENDLVEYNNRVLKHIEEKHYLMLNKPVGFVTTKDDELDRATVMDLIPERYRTAMVSPVGRLDRDSEGLLLLTNDGELAFKLTHPKFEIPKEYVVEIDRPLIEKDKIRIEKGVVLYGHKTKPPLLSILEGDSRKVKVIITEGRKRHIRMMFKIFSYKVKKLKRISLGPLKLGNLKPGSFRVLKKSDIQKIFQPSIKTF